MNDTFRREDFGVQIIASHINTDFDALASMIAAKKLYPNAQLVISSRQHINVRRFLNIYRDTLDFRQDNEIDWSEVSELILVDVSNLSRVSPFTKELREDIKITVYDHHEPTKYSVKKDAGKIERVGAAVTLLIEEIQQKELKMNSFEATLFGLGIYTDTGFFTYNHTTARDLKAASFLMEQGMNLELVERFSEHRLEAEQRKLLDTLFMETSIHEIEGLQIALGTASFEKVHGGLALVAEKLLDLKGTDAVLVVVSMKNHVIIVGRASSERITLLPLLKQFEGGGHKHAGSATLKNVDREEIWQQVKENINLIIKPATSAYEIMSSPVKTISPDTSIEEAGALMYRYEHSGYPVVEGDEIVGIITRRDLDKAIHHGLGHAPVKAYMSTDVITSTPTTPLEEIKNTIINHNIGRLPIVEEGELVGIISRTDIIKALHEEALLDDFGEIRNGNKDKNIRVEMKRQLEDDTFSLLEEIGKIADKMKVNVYLIGGIVRDIMMNVPNDDIDLVVEGNGIVFAETLQQTFGGELTVHETFGTAMWIHPSNIEIDIASSRLEYYERPASLPSVELSTLQEDLYRRDFTINAMAACLNESSFGQLVDPFAGRLDILHRRVRVLHNLSFVEDPTRILRAIRFELRYDFRMDNQTEQLVHNSIEQVIDLSEDRIIAEMKRLFAEHYPTLVLRRLFELHFWEQFGVGKEKIQPSISHAKNLERFYRDHELYGLDSSAPRWLYYFIIPLFYERAIKQAKKFALTKKDMKIIKEISILRGKINFEEKDFGKLHKLLHHHSAEVIVFLLASQRNQKNNPIAEYLKRRKSLTPFIKGNDLAKLGFKPGPHFSEILLQLEIAILQEEVNNKEEAIEWVKNHFS